MLTNKKYVSTRENGSRESCGIANIIVPAGLDIELYKQNFFRTSQLSIVLENGGVVDNVMVTQNIINKIEFPTSYDDLGSQVVWVNKPKQNAIIVIGILNKTNQFNDIGNSSDSVSKKTSKAISEVVVNGENGDIIINATALQNIGGDIYIISSNKESTSKLDINISGKINIVTKDFNITNTNLFNVVIKDTESDENKAFISYERGVGFNFVDEFNNQIQTNDDSVRIKPNKKLLIGDGSEPMLLGDTVKDNITLEQEALTTLFQAIINAPIVAGDGGAAFKAALISAISGITRGDYTNILSKLSSTD